MVDSVKKEKIKHILSEWIVFGIVIIALMIGLVLKTLIGDSFKLFTDGTITVQYPAGWTKRSILPVTEKKEYGFNSLSDEEVLLEVEELQTDSFYKTTMEVKKKEILGEEVEDEILALMSAVNSISFEYMKQLDYFKTLNSEEIVIHDMPGIQLEYTYVNKPPEDIGKMTLPVVVYGIDFILIFKGSVYIVTNTFDANLYNEEIVKINQILDKIQFNKEGV
jgi:hypothetical protein